jgi:hypothetical protein
LRGKRVFRQVQERGQRRHLDQRGGGFPLLDGESSGGLIADQRNVGERGVGGAEINADGKAGCHR